MIITTLTGGLGNQMFQYAIGKKLALKHKTILKLKFTYFPGDTFREYALGCFNIEENFASEEEIKIEEVKRKNVIKKIIHKISPYFRSRLKTIIKNLIYKITPLKNSLYIREKHFHFNPRVLEAPDNVLLYGCWQSEKYFKDIEDIIRQEFTLKDSDQLPENTQEFINLMKSTESVSIHFRRRDYLKKRNLLYHGLCSLDYYYRAINYLTKLIKNPHFFIFSDDIGWVKNNFKISYPITFIFQENFKDYHELILMSKCKHHIIANSSFSWWGAWLGNNPNKIVIAPQKWFNDPSINTNDLIPETWIRI